MKKICLLACSIIIFLLSFNIAFVTSNVADAKDYSTTKDLAASDSATEVNYELPYHGLLPDNPLYFLRIIRDKTVGFLIADPLKKAELNLLQADKRLNAGIYLFNSAKQNEKKINLAISTISKGENYFEKSINNVKEAKREGMDIDKVANKLIDSSKKHQQVLLSLEKRSPQSFKEAFNFQLQRVVVFEKEVISLTSKR